ncbi:MAG TPA: DUF502 domain-containing protein [Rhabdochlamydiaceae bacterium]
MRKYFITGLVILLPVAITVAIILFFVNLLTQPFVGAMTSFLYDFHIVNTGFLFFSPEQVLEYGSKILILALIFAFVVFLGVITRWFFFTAFLKLGDKILNKIPLVNTVYKTTQDIIRTLFVSDKETFKQVVIVPFPSDDTYTLGLVARESPQGCSTAVGDELISVLVPTTPNPTTGFLLMCKRKDLILIDMATEDAIKYIVSCGVIVPEPKAKQRR